MWCCDPHFAAYFRALDLRLGTLLTRPLMKVVGSENAELQAAGKEKETAHVGPS